MPEVKCSVSNCSYWAQGNHCVAETVMIDIDSHNDYDVFDEEFAEEGFHTSNHADVEHQDQVADGSATCCHTFKPTCDE